MKKALSLLGIFALVLALCVGALAEDPIRIGTIYAMSGGNAAIGENILRGIDLAVDETNA